MNKIFYVLIQEDITLGIFDSPDFPKKQLNSYFGKYEIIKFIEVKDSGIQWIADIKTSKDNCQKLTMLYFEINKII